MLRAETWAKTLAKSKAAATHAAVAQRRPAQLDCRSQMELVIAEDPTALQDIEKYLKTPDGVPCC